MTSAVDEVKKRLNIEDVIGGYVQLKRSGRNFKGLSPFSNEKTASFIVSPEKQIWHDFSSGRGGNVFSFVMEMEGLDFKESLELLARQAGVDLSQYQSGSTYRRGPKKDKLYELLELATKFYQTHLTKNQTALSYVRRERGFSKETVLKFKIGYSPNSGSALANFLTKKGFSVAELRAAGVTVNRSGRPYDMFRGRVMIPLADSTGRVIGFTARSLSSNDSGPKYINTPQTVLYDKSRHVFGLHLAKEAIRRNNYVIIVEGNLDVIASHQVGIKQVVATAGTALTEYQLQSLGHLTSDIRLCFDQDQAGLAASERAIPIASRVGVNLYMVDTGTAKDPDELIKRDPKAWGQAIDKPVYALDWLMEHYKKSLDVTSGVGKRKFSDVMLGVIEKLDDPVEQEHFIEKVAVVIGVSKDALITKLGQQNSVAVTRRQPKQPTIQTDQQLLDRIKHQDHFLSLMIMRPELRKFLQSINSNMLFDERAAKLVEYLQQNPDASVEGGLDKGLSSIEDYIKILVLQYEELYVGLESLELHYEASRLQAQLIQQYVKQQKQSLASKLYQANDTDTNLLLEEAKQLDKLLKLNKGALHD